ncbi:ATP-binding protein [Parasphingorhabdus sp.]|uniref:hybrid sensor histidine kinase/response regulator n=1 Tax=Parasphingorhabdus sp. TaxID=2709688 RepID=UPI003A8E2E21
MAELIENSATDLVELRIEQATMLKKRVVGSCLIVQFLISYTASIMYFVSGPGTAALWFVSGTAMVLVTFLYAKLKAPDGITRENHESYLVGHMIVSALTGIVWGAVAIFQTDFQLEYTVFTGCLLVSSITLGGILPSSAYRPGYIALALFAVPPFSAFLMIYAPAPIGLVGFAMFIYFAFAMFLSARVEIDTRDTISARKKKELTERVIQQNRTIQRATEEKTRFLAATGHDLSQPLQSQGFFMQALRDMLDRPDQIALLDQVQDSWRAQKELLQGIVDVSRIDSGAIIPQPVLVNIADACERLASEFLSDNNAKIELITDFEYIETVTDPVLFSRIIRNILSNARKFVPAGGQVEFSLHHANDQAIIEISDNGPGIRKVDIERIFDEYVQLDAANGENPKGLGLGLAIVRRLCRLLAIEMTLYSEPGAGTRFTFRLPIVTSDRVPKNPYKSTIRRFEKSVLVVVVDDDLAVLASMTQLLSSWNCQVISAANQKDAVQLVSRTSAVPALLIIDKHLDYDQHGLDLIEMLREEVNETVPAILMSGQMGKIDIERAGADIEFFNKPVEPDEIWAILDRIMSRPPQPGISER